jgi:hypothetical protein
MPLVVRSRLSYLPGLIDNLVLITGILVLPLAAVATVTSSFIRMTLTLLGIYLGSIVFVVFVSFLSADHHVSVDSQIGVALGFVLAVLAFSAAIFLQYALRRVWISRVVLIALPVLLCAVAILAYRYDQAQMDRTYPIAQGDEPIQVSFDPDPHRYGSSSFQVRSNPRIPISIHLAESGVAEGYVVIPDAVRADFTTSDGSHWDSGWEPIAGLRFLPGESNFNATLSMPLKVYYKFQSIPLCVQLALATTQAQATKMTSIPMPNHRFSVPDFGVCLPRTGWTPFFGQVTGLDCVSALRQPPLTYVTTRWASALCSSSPGEPDSGVLGAAWVGSLDREPAQLGISPVVDAPVNFSNSEIAESGRGGIRFLCPGTAISFTQYSTVRRAQTSVSIQSFILPQMTILGDRITIAQ